MHAVQLGLHSSSHVKRNFIGTAAAELMLKFVSGPTSPSAIEIALSISKKLQDRECSAPRVFQPSASALYDTRASTLCTCTQHTLPLSPDLLLLQPSQ